MKKKDFLSYLLLMETLLKTELSVLTTQFLPEPEVLKQCVTEVQDKLLVKPPIVVYGKVCHQHRDIGFFSNTSKGYQYSGQLASSQPLTSGLTSLLQTVNALYSAEFNGILVNRYNDGSDYISAHSDDESKLDKVGVVSVSYGGVRTFRIRNKKTKAIVANVPMVSGLLVHMGGHFQKEFTHEIPLEKRIDDCRYSFTFRKHLE